MNDDKSLLLLPGGDSLIRFYAYVINPMIRKIVLPIVIGFYCLISLPLLASEKITVAFGDALAPWVIPETNEGIIIDIIEATMKPIGYDIEKVYLPYARRIKAYQQGQVDVVSDMNPKTIEHENLKGFYSGTAYEYENFAISLKKRDYQFKTIMDLVDYRLMSWQGAVTHLGGDYALMASKNPNYSEHHDQASQVKLLFLERVDVIQIDQQIFNYFRAEVARQGQIDTTEEVDYFPLFGPSPNGFLFRSRHMQDEFNTQLQRLKDSGQYFYIMRKYGTFSVE